MCHAVTVEETRLCNLAAPDIAAANKLTVLVRHVLISDNDVASEVVNVKENRGCVYIALHESDEFAVRVLDAVSYKIVASGILCRCIIEAGAELCFVFAKQRRQFFLLLAVIRFNRQRRKCVDITLADYVNANVELFERR